MTLLINIYLLIVNFNYYEKVRIKAKHHWLFLVNGDLHCYYLFMY